MQWVKSPIHFLSWRMVGQAQSQSRKKHDTSVHQEEAILHATHLYSQNKEKLKDKRKKEQLERNNTQRRTFREALDQWNEESAQVKVKKQ